MNRTSENDYPRICHEVGLACHTCTDATARQLEKACKGLQGKAIAQLFVQIHPHTACSKMRAHFATSYRSASSERQAAMVAVA